MGSLWYSVLFRCRLRLILNKCQSVHFMLCSPTADKKIKQNFWIIQCRCWKVGSWWRWCFILHNLLLFCCCCCWLSLKTGMKMRVVIFSWWPTQATPTPSSRRVTRSITPRWTPTPCSTTLVESSATPRSISTEPCRCLPCRPPAWMAAASSIYLTLWRYLPRSGCAWAHACVLLEAAPSSCVQYL